MPGMFVRRRRTARWIVDGEYSYVRSRLICEGLGHQNLHCACRCRQTLGVRAGYKPEKRSCEYGGKEEVVHGSPSLLIDGGGWAETRRPPWRLGGLFFR